MVARRAHNPKAVGSNPTPATNSRRMLIKMMPNDRAQLISAQPLKAADSNPTPAPNSRRISITMMPSDRAQLISAQPLKAAGSNPTSPPVTSFRRMHPACGYRVFPILAVFLSRSILGLPIQAGS